MRTALAILLLLPLVVGCERNDAFSRGDIRLRPGESMVSLPREVPPEPNRDPEETAKQEFERYRVHIRDAVERASGNPTQVVVFTSLVTMENGSDLQVVLSDKLSSLCVIDGLRCERNLSHMRGDDGSRYVFSLNERNSPDDARMQSFLDIILFPKDGVPAEDVVAALADKGHVWVEPWSVEFPPMVTGKSAASRVIHDTAESQRRIEKRLDAIEEKLELLLEAEGGDE